LVPVIGVDVDWSEMETCQPRLAGLGRRRLLEPGVLLGRRSAVTARPGSAR